ncbi:MAG: BamA/TamA family outer membrane protein [Deltaproteobacteria bacterium]|nr:BamA/TamA family outer membrane protein [Deltaproteobacteria bacterium]MDQ3297309.1 BamA/TamA family outer membrane protein [Myxococcota bacterium]
MTAKQTLVSASLVVLLVASSESHADPEVPAPTGEVRPDDPITPAPVIGPAKPMPKTLPREPTGSFSIGAGYHVDDRFIATAQVAQDDLFLTGTRLALTMKLSRREQLALVRFEDPTLLGRNVRLRADLYNHRLVYPGPGFTREATGGDLALSVPLTRHAHAFFGYRIEQVAVELGGESLVARGVPGAVPGQPLWRGGRIASLRAGLAYSTLDAPDMPTRGTSLGTSLELADRAFGSEVQLLRTSAWASHHRQLGPFTLHLGGTASSVSTSAPLSERLHFDGSDDIRGYAPGAVGPRDLMTGMPLGGNFKYTARGELELPLIPRWGLSVAGFVDAGGIYGQDKATDGGGSAASAGFGMIWRTPIGALRFDVAFPLDGGSPRFQFSLGGSW